MSFRIEFVRHPLRDEAPDHYMVGRAYLSDGELSFLSSTGRAPISRYETQWRGALTALANGVAPSVALWTDLPADPATDFGTVLALYAEESGLVRVREQLVFPGTTQEGGNDIDWPDYKPPIFAESNDDGIPISTWHTSLAEIAIFLD